MTTRRSFLRTTLGAGAGLGLAGTLGGFTAAASPAGGYKALVCIKLDGGMDGHDLLIPTNAGAYAGYAGARRAILDEHEARGDDSRSRDALLALGDASVGMPRQLAPLAALYRTGALSVAANVGPLEERTDRAAVLDRRASLPLRLFSHNDQRSTWATGEVEQLSEGKGWGGLMMERGPGAPSPYASIAFTNDGVFAAGDGGAPFRMGTGRLVEPTTSWGQPDANRLYEEHLTASAARLDNLFATDFQNAQRRVIASVETLADALDGARDGDAVAIPENPLSEQLAMVAKLISVRARLGVARQVFVLNLNGFDTHKNQAAELPVLQTQLAEAVAAFYRETVRQGVADDVLTFTTSEFGRTLTPNSNGTDHGWGNHHLLVGGSVRGGRLHGAVPEAGLEHDLDAGRGRLIPTTATEQYAGGIGRWFGVPEDALDEILPRRGRFGPALDV